MRHTTRFVYIALLALGATAALASPPGFDEPLAEFSRTVGGDVRSAASGVGTADGASGFGISTPGTVLEAWVYRSGDVRRDPELGTLYGPDPGRTLRGGAIAGALPVVGAEVARRLVLSDDGDNDGEVVRKAAVPPLAFLAGSNTFVVSDVNEIDPASGMSHYRRQHGVAVLVAYRGNDGTAQRETILLEGGDWFFRDRFKGDPAFADEIAGELACFGFSAPLECGQSAYLRFAVGGLVEQPLSANERTFVLSGSGPKPASLSGGVGSLLEQNTLNLNRAAPQAGGGSCGGAIEARVAGCYSSLCDPGASGNTISNSMCIDDLDEFNNSADSLEPYGSFLSPGPADPASCKASRGNGWFNRSDCQGDMREFGPPIGGRDTSLDRSASTPSPRSIPKPFRASRRGKH